MERPDWDEYFLGIAKAVSARASCPRASVGAVVVKDNRIISTGYNGAQAGDPHCMDIGCIMIGGHCSTAVHAEVNAIAQAAKFGLSVDGGTVYYWDSLDRSVSCRNCLQVMIAAGIVRIVGNSTFGRTHA